MSHTVLTLTSSIARLQPAYCCNHSTLKYFSKFYSRYKNIAEVLPASKETVLKVGAALNYNNFHFSQKKTVKRQNNITILEGRKKYSKKLL